MADITKELQGKITFDTSDAEEKLGGFGGSLSRIGEIAAGLGLEQLGERILSLGEDALKFSVDYAANLEQVRIAFNAFTGSAEKGKQVLTEVSDFARRTPFTLPQVEDAAKQILGFNLATEQSLIPMLKDVGNLAAATGQPLTVAVDLLARAREGIFNIREFGQFGIAREELEKFGVEFTKTGAVVNKGELLPALQKLIQSRFGDLMAEESKTLTGTVTNIKDDLGRLAATLVGVDPATAEIQKGSIFDRLKTSATDFLVFLDAHQKDIQTFLNNAMDAFGRVADFLSGVFGPILKQIGDIYNRHKESIDLLAKVLGGALVVALIAVIEVLAKAIELGLQLVDNFLDMVDKIRKALAPALEFLKSHWDQIKSVLNDIIGLVDTVIGKFNQLANAAHINISLPNIPHFAAGGYASGLALVGENGPELVNLPAGSYVHNNAESQQMMGGVTVNFNNPTVRNDNDLQEIISAVKSALGRENELVRLGAL